MEGYVKEAALNLTQREWQIIELREMTSYDTGKKDSKKSSGEFVAWVMIGTDSLRKVQITVPRVVYISTRVEIRTDSQDILELKKVEKHLPHSKTAPFLYEVSMAEYVYRNKNWAASLRPLRADQEDQVLMEEIYETGTPLMMRILTELGCVSKLTQSASRKQQNSKSHLLSELTRVDRPNEGLYLNCKLTYKRSFLYVRINPKTKTGLIAFFAVNRGSGGLDGQNKDGQSEMDMTAPSRSKPGTFDVSASCQLWIIKPGSSRGQKNLSLRQCEGIFTQLLATIQETADLESEYACVSAASSCDLSGLRFVDREDVAYSSVNDAINSYVKSNNGPTFLLLNSNRPPTRLRRQMPMLNSLPIVPLPFPPGPDHNPSMSTLPALNWEQPAVQLCLEAYLYMGIVSFPKRIAYARYGNVPVGNLGEEENFALYEVGMARILQKNRALSWASPVSGCPDLGTSFFPSSEGKFRPSLQSASSTPSNHDDAWGDEDELVSPVVRRPGCYRTVCVDIDLHDLAIAALTDTASFSSGSSAFLHTEGNNPSPSTVAQFDERFNSFKQPEPLGDEMSTSTALPMLRALVTAWLKDAFSTNNEIADAILHHVYRLVSSPKTLMHDPALHRVVHSLMKATFMRLLGELQRLGCSVVYATFHKITVATNKASLADAEEYVNFVVSTIRSQAGEHGEEASALSRIALRPRQFHAHYLFLDEYNFGTMQLERHEKIRIDEEYHIDEGNGESAVVPSVVTAWNIMNFMGSEIAMEYFRIIIGRFSKEVLKKQVELQNGEEGKAMPSVFCSELREQLLNYRKKMVSTHFAAYLTRAVAEIIKDNRPAHNALRMAGTNPANPVLEFIKSVMAVLELDRDVDTEVHVLKRSLLAQVGVAEYSSLAKWENPCPSFILPDVFCGECHESRDINLCYIPPGTEERAKQVSLLDTGYCSCSLQHHF
jgi:DNA polymerase epsilon subunit 1